MKSNGACVSVIVGGDACLVLCVWCGGGSGCVCDDGRVTKATANTRARQWSLFVRRFQACALKQEPNEREREREREWHKEKNGSRFYATVQKAAQCFSLLSSWSALTWFAFSVAPRTGKRKRILWSRKCMCVCVCVCVCEWRKGERGDKNKIQQRISLHEDHYKITSKKTGRM